MGEREEGVQQEPPGVGGEFPSPRAPMGKTGWLKITLWVKRPGGQRVAHGTCQAWLSAELVHTGQLHFVDKHGPRCRVGVGDQCSVGMGKMGSQLNVTVSHRPFREALNPCALSLADTH